MTNYEFYNKLTEKREFKTDFDYLEKLLIKLEKENPLFNYKLQLKEKNKEELLDRLYIGLDIETTPFNITELKIDIIGCYLYNSDIDIFFDSTQQFVEFILSSKRDITFFVHNLQFDINIIFNQDRLPDLDFNIHNENDIILGNVYPIIDSFRDKEISFKKSTSKRKTKLNYEMCNINGELPRFFNFSFMRKEKRTILSRKIHIEFIDTMNFVPTSLKNLMSSFTPELTKFKNQVISIVSLSGKTKKFKQFDFLRNKADILATVKIPMEHFFFPFTKRTKIRSYFSMASYSFALLHAETNYQYETQFKYGSYDRPQNIYEKEKEAFYGGAVIVNPKFVNKLLKDYCYCDFNSLYNYVMSIIKIPTDFISHNILNYNKESSKEYLREKSQEKKEGRLFYIIAYANQPILPQKIKGRNVIAKGLIEGWYCEYELYSAMFGIKGKSKLDWIEIKEEMVYKTKNEMFKDFSLKYYKTKENVDKQREEMKSIYKKNNEITRLELISYLKSVIEENNIDNNEFLFQLENYNKEDNDFREMIINETWNQAKRRKSKLIPNTSYGKFAQLKRYSNTLDKIKNSLNKEDLSIFKRFYLKDIENLNEIDDSFGLIDSSKSNWKIRFENGFYSFERKGNEESRKSVTIVSVFITSKARALLLEVFNFEKDAYCDTDGFITNREIETSTELGKIKKEWFGDAIVYGKKEYDKIINGELIRKAKGIPKNAKKLTEKEYYKWKEIIIEARNKRRKIEGKPLEKLMKNYNKERRYYLIEHVIKPREAKRKRKIPYSIEYLVKENKTNEEKELLRENILKEKQEKIKKEIIGK